MHPVLQVVIGQRYAGAAEAIGFHRVRARVEVISMNVLNDIRPRSDEDLRTILVALVIDVDQ